MAGARVERHAVIAHRGASYDAPEETLAAYERAASEGADYFEMDLQRTRDGAIIAVHDASFARTSDVAARFPARKDAAASAFTLAEIKQLDAGSWFNAAHPERARPEYVGLRVATLDEIIDVADARHRKLYVETKDPERYPGIERDIIAVLARRHALDRVIFQSFSAPSLKVLAILAPDVPRVFLVDAETREKNGGYDGVVALARSIRADGIGPRGTEAWAYASRAHAAGLFIHPWVIDEPWQLALADDLDVDAVFSNRPDVVVMHYAGK
jgi:glycerophosphoryl diester phosphodiesterase